MLRADSKCAVSLSQRRRWRSRRGSVRELGGAEDILFGRNSEDLECDTELACSMVLTGVGARPEDLM
jgi:hypothetical protein